MQTYLLIPGAWHGAWCWHKVVVRLESLGHKVLTPDLPGYGCNGVATQDVSLPLWREFVCDLLDSRSEPIILVGHSRAGIIITEAAEHRPNRIKTLVYVTAFLPRDGECLLDLAAQAEGSELLPNIVPSADGSSLTVRTEALRKSFYDECSNEDIALARMLIQPEPALPSSTPVRVTETNFGRVPRVYIECLRDRAITLSLQRQMIAGTPCQQVLSIDTDHSPFLSRPGELASHLSTL